MTNEIVPDYIAQRPAYQEFLFGDAYPSFEQPTDELAMTALCRSTNLVGRMSKQLQGHLASLPDTINDVLADEDITARLDGDATFGFITDARTLKQIGAVTVHIISDWERARVRHGMPPLLTHVEKAEADEAEEGNRNAWLITEVAAAVMATHRAKDGFNITKDNDAKNLALLLARFGPNYIQSWFNGNTIRKWLQEQGLSETEQDDWLQTFTPGMRKYVIKNNRTNPLKAIARTKELLENDLSDESIANHLQVTIEEARALFTPAQRREIATYWTRSPLDVIQRIKYNLDQLLNDEQLASKFGWDAEWAQKMFPQWLRVELATAQDPLKRARLHINLMNDRFSTETIAATLGWQVPRTAL